MILDMAVIAVYMLGVNLVGMRVSKSGNISDYFLGGKNISWKLVCLSIVATETSSLTFISIPGLAYVSGTGFLQIALGYIIGRILVAFVLLPGYFDGGIETAYQYLQRRFGPSSRKFMAVIFHATRLLADSIRLFATAIPLSMLLGLDSYWQSILIMGIATFFYTYHGGIRSVIITDAIQLFVYIAGAAAGMAVVSSVMDRSPWEIMCSMQDSFRFISSGVGSAREFFGTYNIFSGIIGGTLLSFASHGTDHLIVQRVLSCGDLGSARKTIIWSGILVFFQFALFLGLGLFIKSMLGGRAFERPDEIIPFFIVNHVPHGLKGLMLAGIFAAAMSTLSSSINSLSSSTINDILGVSEKGCNDADKLKISRRVSVLWTAVIIGISIILKDMKNPLVEVGLGIASVTYGGMLGIFIQGRLFRGFSDRAAMAGVILSIAAVIAASLTMNVFWPWYVPIGFTVSIVSGSVLNAVIAARGRRVAS
jgi:SSS family transporter